MKPFGKNKGSTVISDNHVKFTSVFMIVAGDSAGQPAWKHLENGMREAPVP